jgi:hypothetical protein
MNLRWQATKISSVLSHRYSTKRKSPLMPMLGSAPLNPSSLFLQFHLISWEEFRNAFRAHHIPEGLMERKLSEFLALTQGTRTVLQYAQAFNHVCQ